MSGLSPHRVRARPGARLLTAPGAIALTIVALSGCDSTGRAAAIPEAKARTLIERTAQACRARAWSEAAGYFAYSGPDRSRKFKDVYEPDNEQELHRVQTGGCDGLFYGFSDPNAEFAFGEFSTDSENEAFWYIQELTFPNDPDASPVHVAMLEIDGRLVIGDVD